MVHASTVRIELRQQRERHGRGDAVVVLARIEPVRERQRRAAHDELVGVALGRQLVGLVEQDVRERQLEDRRVPRLGVAAPRLERLAAEHVVGDALVEERAQRVLVREHVAAARLVAEALHLVEEPAVVLHERALGRVLVADERVGDEHARGTGAGSNGA